jgi:two-component system chemotaxis sensor kinase CheA
VLRQTGDRLGRLEQDLERLTAALDQDGRRLAYLDQVARQLDSEVRRVRMLPFAEACQGLERAVRDLAQAGGKQVDLVVEGGRVELDRSVLEGLKDPLNHLVRNAVDHGIEPSERRRAAGKPPVGRVTVAAELRGSQVEVVVADDGAGLDLDALRAVARKRGLPEPPEGSDMTHLIFLPGLSTAPIITDVSGRGVGLDVVKQRVEQLHGTIELASEPGRGTRFTLAVPLTLTTIRALLVVAGGQALAFPTTNVRKLILVGPDDVHRAGGREVLVTEGAPLPIAALAEALGLAVPKPAGAAASGRRPALIAAAGERRMAFVVDELLTEQEVVVKALGARIRRVRNFSGGTILPSGRVALVLNVAQLVRTALGRAPGATLAPAAPAAAPLAAKRLLVVDDSITTRTLEKSLLEAAGYQVATAVDGADAWRFLQEQGADLVLSDVEMPRMDGLELTEAIRASPRFTDLPVVLLTARASEHDKARGVEVGADAYLVKDEFDQRALLETVAQLL